MTTSYPILKFSREKTAGRSHETIWEAFGGQLYRVLEINYGQYHVEILLEAGWVQLIIFKVGDSLTPLAPELEVETHKDAINAWLMIEAPTTEHD